MRLTAAVLPLLLTLAQGVKTVVPPASMAIVIKTDKDAIKVGQPLQLTIKLVNLTDSEVDGRFTEMDGSDITDVLQFKDVAGRDLPAFSDSSATSIHSYRPRGGYIKAGGEREWQTVIYPSAYVMGKPGSYTFQVVRPDLDDQQKPEILSNGIAFRLKPAVNPR